MTSDLSEESLSDDARRDLDDSLLGKVVERLDRQWADERRRISLETGILAGQQLGRYRVHEVVGRGAFGQVYRATDVELDREVALKVPHPEVLIDSERLNRFLRESEVAAGLAHAGIVPIYEAGFDGGTPYIAFAWCRGPDLGKWLEARTKPVPALEAAMFVAHVADAVHFAHTQEVLHRDLKPGNILLEPRSAAGNFDELSGCRPLLTDFGLARCLEGGLKETHSSLLVGTPYYMAPEQLSAESRKFSPATDTYALGVILFELVTLRTPFDGATYVEVLDKLRSAQPPRLRDIIPDLPRDYEAICQKCLEKDPADRY